ncbi:MAG: autotransporter assembly complex family protein [Pseudomonadales bacterium]
MARLISPEKLFWLVIALTSAMPVHAELEISGVADDVRDGLQVLTGLDELPCDAPRWWVDRAYRQAVEQLRRGMEAYGYYHATVTGELKRGEQCWNASFAIEPGDPVRIGRAAVVVAPPLGAEPGMIAALKGLDLQPEERFSHSGYEAAKSRLLDVAQSLGYFDAEFTRHQVSVDLPTNTADIDLELDGGTRYRIGHIETIQEDLHQQLFEQFLTVHEGDYYDAAEITKTYRQILESGYFDRVLVAPELEARADGTVPVTVRAVTGTRRTALIGAGFATDTGPRLRSEIRYRRINRRGHRAGASMLLSPVQSELTGDYRLPYGDPTHEWLSLTGGFSYDDTDSYTSTKRNLGVARTHRLGQRWTETNYVDWRLEDFDIAGETGRTQLTLLGTSLSRTTSIDAPRPVRGHALSIDVRGAAKQLLSDTNVLQVIGRAKQIVPLTDRLRLLGRVSAGWTWQSEFEELPPSIRFFAGGDNSVRGYAYESLGPEEDGVVVGGRRLLTGSLELDALVRPKWSVAVFADSGSAFDDAPTFSSSVGLGVRWYSILGPIRVDIAHPLDDPGHTVRLHISLGPDL